MTNHYTFHEIDTDGRGPNVWEMSIDGDYAGTLPDYGAMIDAMTEASIGGGKVTIYSIQWWQQLTRSGEKQMGRA
jgi:hypothetical protein